MAHEYDEYLGFIRYEGSSVEEGFLDARKAAEALLGFDESLRFFLNKQGVDIDFEIPVRIRKGSWEALIPHTLLGWIVTSGGIIVTTYLSTAAKNLAANDFKNVSLGELIQKSLKKIQAIIKITKHVGLEGRKEIKGVKFEGNKIFLPNFRGKLLTVSKDEFDDYLDCPPHLLSKLTSVIEENRKLKVGLIKEGRVKEEEISFDEKPLFYKNALENEEIFPELKDGVMVTIRGKITKGNQKTDFLGLEYKGHILNCRTEKGKVPIYKEFLFLKCEVVGVVDRQTSGDKKPQIVIYEIKKLEEDRDQNHLF